VVVITAGGEVLLMRRCRPAGFWQSVTGSLEWGETAPQAAARELYEETGLRAGGRLIDLRRKVRFPIVGPWRARYAPDRHWNLEHAYALLLPHRRLIRLAPGEHREYRWLPWPQAARRATSWSNREAIVLLGEGLFGVRKRFEGSASVPSRRYTRRT